MDKQRKKITIAIDGYSSCGKSTLAKALATSLHYVFVDSGAMYRAVCLFAIRHQLIRNQEVDHTRLIALLDQIELSFHKDKTTGEQTLLLNGEAVSAEIRSLEVSQAVSQVATIREVRKKLVHQQQIMGRKGGIVMDGRDIGTVVFPHAELKLFLTASIAVRTQRRYDEMIGKGQTVDLETVRTNLIERDRIDSTRAESPLRQADDAIVIDNSYLTPEEQLKKALTFVHELTQQQVLS